MREVFIITEEGKHIYYRIPNIPEDAPKEETNNPKYSHAFYLEDYMEKNNIDVDAKNKTSYGLAEENEMMNIDPELDEPKNQNLKRFYKNIEKNLKSQKESENNEYRPNI